MPWTPVALLSPCRIGGAGLALAWAFAGLAACGTHSTPWALRRPDVPPAPPVDAGAADARSEADVAVDAEPRRDVTSDVGEAADTGRPTDPSADAQSDGDSGVGACPVVDVHCRVVGEDAWWSETLDARIGSRVECEPVLAADADAPELVSWEIVERPSGSTTSFVDPAAWRATFDLDATGSWVVRVAVPDGGGRDPCGEFWMRVRAIPRTAMHVQLVWHTPADPDETDSGFGAGSDVDLHLLHPNGCWGDRHWDCHWRAQEPNWGDPASRGDDPSMDIDDSDGAGPEIIAFNGPEDGRRYRVGVHLYNDHGYGAVYATVRIYLFDALVFEDERELPARDAFWDVAAISWPDGEITILDALYETPPPCD